MSLEAWITIGVIVLCFSILAFSRWAPDIVLMGGVTVLMVAGVINPQQALSGLANEGMVTVAVLFIVSAGLKETGAISWVSDALLGKPRSDTNAQLRIMAPVAAFSAFLNNTPVVAMMIPTVTDWARKYGLSASKLFMPMSYAAIVGGTCTLIGTSTNLVINGLLIKQTGSAGLGMFDLSWIGLPCALVAFIYVTVAGRWLLPERKSITTQFADARQYTVEMMVVPNSPLIGKSIEEAGLRQLDALYLIEIDRRGNILPAVSPQERLESDDRLVFAGVVDSIVDLQKIRGLQPATEQVFKVDVPRPERCFIEAVVSDTCGLVGKSVKEGRFRSLYNAAIIAVARNGEQLKKKIGEIVLQPGDTLLLEGSPGFFDRHRNSRDFFLVSRLEGASRPRHDRAMLAMAILAAMIVLVTTGALSMLQAAMLAAGGMIVSRCLTGEAARSSVDWQVLVVIAASFGIGQALFVSGAAEQLANVMTGLASDKPMVALTVVYVVTAVLTAMITNNAAAVLMFPIVLSIAESLGVSYMPFVIVLMIAASASFATPIGYQTNLMVMGPGGYHFSDYLKMGLPLTALIGVLCVLLVPLVWPF